MSAPPADRDGPPPAEADGDAPGGSASPTGSDPANTGAGAPTEPEQRGRLDIDSSVIRKLAAYVVDRQPGTAKVTRTMRSDRGASVRVGRGREALDLDLVVALDYPVDVRATVATVREKVTEEIGRTTGYRVRAIDVTVSALRAAGGAPRVR